MRIPSKSRVFSLHRGSPPRFLLLRCSRATSATPQEPNRRQTRLRGPGATCSTTTAAFYARHGITRAAKRQYKRSSSRVDPAIAHHFTVRDGPHDLARRATLGHIEKAPCPVAGNSSGPSARGAGCLPTPAGWFDAGAGLTTVTARFCITPLSGIPKHEPIFLGSQQGRAHIFGGRAAKWTNWAEKFPDTGYRVLKGAKIPIETMGTNPMEKGYDQVYLESDNFPTPEG